MLILLESYKCTYEKHIKKMVKYREYNVTVLTLSGWGASGWSTENITKPIMHVSEVTSFFMYTYEV